jgi:hypothetical protein
VGAFGGPNPSGRINKRFHGASSREKKNGLKIAGKKGFKLYKRNGRPTENHPKMRCP